MAAPVLMDRGRRLRRGAGTTFTRDPGRPPRRSPNRGGYRAMHCLSLPRLARGLAAPGLLAAGLLAAGLLAACSQPSQERALDLTVPVTLRPVTLGTIESTVPATGTLRPARAAEVLTEVRGDLLYARPSGRAPVANGRFVEAGQLLFELRNEEWVLGVRLKSRQLALESARRARREKETLQGRGLTTDAELEAARKAAADAESDVQDAELQIAKTRYLAPIAGYVTGLTDLTEGTRVEQGISLCWIMDYRQVVVDLRIPSARIQEVRLGQPVRVANVAFPDRIFAGQTTAVDPTLDATTRTFKVQATVDNQDLALRPGMFVRADIVAQSHRNVVLVPRELVLTRQGRPAVFVEESARAEMREVETGLTDGQQVEIVRGLEPGDRLIASNYETLRPRSRVQVTGVSEPAPR
ncbi:MAG: efflux RND transporter periplasmic adaptor subunit [Gemmatimonadota bacterium]